MNLKALVAAYNRLEPNLAALEEDRVTNFQQVASDAEDVLNAVEADSDDDIQVGAALAEAPNRAAQVRNLSIEQLQEAMRNEGKLLRDYGVSREAAARIVEQVTPSDLKSGTHAAPPGLLIVPQDLRIVIIEIRNGDPKEPVHQKQLAPSRLARWRRALTRVGLIGGGGILIGVDALFNPEPLTKTLSVVAGTIAIERAIPEIPPPGQEQLL